MLLKIMNLEAYIGQFYILQGVNIELEEGEIIVLLGRNGAGKTTTLRCIMGLVPVSGGSIEFNGKPTGLTAPYNIANLGITLVPEDQGIFSQLTVAENIRVASRGTLKQSQNKIDVILQIFPDLKNAWKRKAGGLSGGQKQMLAIARSLVNDNKVIMLDEPSKGLAPVLVSQLGEAIMQLKTHTSVLLVEQNFGFAKKIANRYYILSDGRTVMNGVMTELIGDVESQRRYLGVSS